MSRQTPRPLRAPHPSQTLYYLPLHRAAQPPAPPLELDGLWVLSSEELAQGLIVENVQDDDPQFDWAISQFGMVRDLGAPGHED